MRARLFAVSLIAAALFGCLTAWSAAPAAELYSAIVTAQPADSDLENEWVYTVTNTSPSTDYAIWLLQIEVDQQTSVMGVSNPQYWNANLDVPNLILWSTARSAGYIQSGTVGEGFRANYDSTPAYQGWTVMFKNIADPGDMPVDFGDVVVPEPGSAAATLIGLASLAAQLVKRRGRE